MKYRLFNGNVYKLRKYCTKTCGKNRIYPYKDAFNGGFKESGREQ